MHSGRGRMSLVEKEDATYLGIWSGDVRLPKGTSSLAGRSACEKLFRLATVNRLVRATVKVQREEDRSAEGK